MIKRGIDFVIALFVLIFSFPVLLGIALLVRINLGTPVLFRQFRPGKDERLFEMIKFRTMREAHDENGNELPDGVRLTKFGAFLRSTSLDELPELLNVLKGDMSLVGPRPLLVRYTDYFTDNERLRFTVRPGITGWAQINGRNESEWSRRLADDVWYVNNRTLFLDVKIIFKTIAKVLSRKGAVPDANLVMEDLDVCRKK